MVKRLLGRALSTAAVAAALLALWPAPAARSAPQVLGTGGSNTAYAGQRNMIYIPNRGYWAFFKMTNSDRVVYRYSADGITWKAKDEGGNWVAQADVFPYLQTAPDAAWPASSVWYAPDLNRVYVVANDGTADIGAGGATVDMTKTDGTGNKLFLRWGTLSADGSIAWDPASGIRRQRMTLRLNTATNCQWSTNNRNQTWDPRAQRSAVVSYSSSAAGGYLALFADTAENRLGTGGYEGAGTIGITNLTLDATGYWGAATDPNVWMYCHYIGNNGTDQDASLDVLAGPAIAPVLDGGTPRWVLGTRTDNIDDANNRDGGIITLGAGVQPGGGGTLSQNALDLNLASQIHNVTLSGDQEGYGMSALNEMGTSIAHFTWIDRNGQVRYQRRTSAGAMSAAVILDNAGSQLQPSMDPAISLSYKKTTTDAYVIWVSTNQDEIRYRACRNNAVSTALCDATVVWRTGASLNNPKLGFWGGTDEPMPVLYSDVNSVYFDEIITSTYAIPTVTSVSTLPASAYLTTPTYELNIVGTNFEPQPRIPSFYVLASSRAQADISVGSVTWVSKTNMRAFITLSTHVLTDFDFDLRVRMADGQEYPSRYDRNGAKTVDKSLSLRLNPPVISGVSDFDTGVNPFASGGVLLSNDGTTALSRPLRLFGSDFMNWTGFTGVIEPSSYTVKVEFQRQSDGFIEPGIAVASLTYSGSTSLTTYLKISTSVAGGPYTVLLTNPSSGTALSLGGTFYVTVPTASVTSPGPGNNLGFSVVAGTVGFNNDGQTGVSTAGVRITHLVTGKVWNGSVMTLSGFATEENKWKFGTLSPSATAFTFPFDTSNTVNIPDDGPYEIAVRAQTRDGGVGDPHNPTHISTVGINLDRYPPTALLQLPVAGSTSNATSIVGQFSDLGSGVLISSIMVQDIGIPTGSTETWVAFTTAGVLHGEAGVPVWLSTAAPYTPEMKFASGQVGAITAQIDNTTDIKLPQWQNGHKYAISAFAKDSAGRFIDQSTSGTSAYTTFIFDNQKPTVTISMPAGLALSSGAATWVTGFTGVSGLIRDNVADNLDQQHVFVRVAELAPGAAESVSRWLDPATLAFASIAPGEAYKEFTQTLTAADASDPWSWDLTAAANQFADGKTYRIEAYARDSAGNSTGTAVSPVLRYYLRLDNTPPTIAKVLISTDALSNSSVVIGTNSSVGLYYSSNPLTSIRLHLNDGTGSGIAAVRYNLRYNGQFGLTQYDQNAFAVAGDSWPFQNPELTYYWNNATSTTTIPFQVALATSIPWRSSQDYFLHYEITDVAGNIRTFDWRFIYDTSPPTISGISIASGTTFGDSADLPNAITGQAVDELNQIGKNPAGMFQVGVGVRRASDGKWFNASGPSWLPARADPVITSFSGNNWTFSPLGDLNASFWDSRSTETYSLYVWGQDNVVSTYTNVSSTITLKAVFHWEVQAPSSTLVAPSTSFNNVWYSSHTGFDLPFIIANSFDRPTGGAGVGADTACSMTGGPGGWPGGSANICAVETEIQETGSGQCWNGTSFGATCGTPSAFRAMTVIASSYTYNTQIGVAGELWESMANGGTYRVRVRGKDSAVTSGAVWKPNTEVPATPVDCNNVSMSVTGVRCVRVDKAPPATVITNPVNSSDITAPVASIDGSAGDPGTGSGLGKTFIAICQDSAGSPDFTKCLTGPSATGPTGADSFTGALNWFEKTGASWSLNTNAVSAWSVGVFYHIIARSTDNVNNVEQWGAAAANNSNHVRIRIVAPGSSGSIVKPSIGDATFPFYQPTTLTSITGIAVGNTHAQLRIKDLDANLYFDNNAAYPWIAVSTWVTSPTGALINVVGTDWLYAFPGPWRNNANYTVDLRVCNSVEGGCSGVLDTQTFVIDSSAPVNAVTNPSMAAHRVGQLASLSGTVNDPSAPAQPNSLLSSSVRFRVVRMKDAKEWSINASTFTTAPGDDLVGSDQGGGLFTYTTTYLTSEMMFEDGYQYRANLTATDKAGNTGTAVGNVFRYDISLPTAAITVPLPTVVINTLATISGTARDPNPKLGDSNSSPSGVASVEVKIQRNANGSCFGGVNFGTVCSLPAAWLPATGFYQSAPGVATFTYTNANLDIALVSGQYVIAVRAVDVAGNVQAEFTAAGSSFTMTVDKDAPTVAIAQPSLAAYTPAAAAATGIQGTADDPLINGTSAGLLVPGVDVLLWHVLGPTSYYWTGAGFSTTVSSVQANGTNWTLPLVPTAPQYLAGGAGGATDKIYYTFATAHDASTLADGSVSQSSGNLSAPSAVTSFIVDGTPPISTMTGIVDGSYVNALSALAGTHDGSLSGTQKVEIRITTNPVTGPDWTGSSYTFTTPYWTTATLAGLNWTYNDLTGAFADNQLYFLYSRATDLVGNVQSPVTVYGVHYDVTPPAISISFPASPPANPPYSNNAESTRVSTYTWGAISDVGAGASGITQVWVGISSGAAQDVWWNEADRDFTTSQSSVAWSTQVYKGGTSWQYVAPEYAGKLADGVNYTVFVYARDLAGNTINFVNGMLPGASAGAQTQPFTYDLARPTSTVSVPVNGGAINGLADFSGVAIDPGANPSGVSKTYMAIRHTDGGAAGIGWWNWNTNAFDGAISDPPPAPPSAAWTQVASTTIQGLASLAWSTGVPAGMLESSATYRVVVDALDTATNLQQGPTPVGSGSAFRYDATAPTATITGPAYGSYLNAASLGQILGTATDETTGASGLQSVQIVLKLANAEAYWNGGVTGVFGSDYDTTPGTKYNQWRTVTGTFNWSQVFPPMAPAESRAMRLWVRATDRAGNVSAVPTIGQFDADLNADGTSPAYPFIYDNTPPTTLVTAPAVFVNFAPATITGTAVDAFPAFNPSGVVDVKLRMRRSTGEFWDMFSSTWTTSPSFSNTSLTGLNPWTFSNFNGAFQDGYRFDVNASGIDAATNLETAYSTYSFIVDRSTPLSSVLWPNTGAFVSSAAVTIRGTAEDRFLVHQPALYNPSRQYESGLTGAGVTVAVAEVVVSTNWWDGANFASAVPVWLPAAFDGASSGTWTFPLPAGKLTSTKYYRAVVRAQDQAGNLDLVTSTNTFIYDTAAPVSLATAPTGFNTGLPAIYGTASDDAPGALSAVRLTIHQTQPFSQYWNGSAWQGTAVEITSGVIGANISGTTYGWSYDATSTAFLNASTVTITARAVDQVGNVEAPHGAYDIEFYLEAPTPSLIMTQPPAPDLRHYGPNSAGAVNVVIGTGQNLRAAAGVRLALRRLTEPTSYWYDPTASWTNDPSTYTALPAAPGTPQTWSLALNSPYTVDNASYSLTVTPVNNAGLLGTAISRTFVFDKTVPVASFTNPVIAACAGADACLNAMPAIAGTAADATNTNPPSILFSGMKVRLKNSVTGDYWNGTAFAPGLSEISIEAANFTGTGPFAWSTTTLAGPMLLDGEDYTLFAHAADKAANDQSIEASMTAFTFVYDTSPPLGILSQPSSGQVYLNLATISGTSADPGGANANNKFSGVQRVELQIREPHNDICWNNAGSVFNVACPNFFTATGVNPWSYSNPALTTLLTSGKPYTITARAVDFAGNTQTLFTAPLSSRTLNVDKTAPTAAFTKPLQGVSYRSSQLNGGSALTGTSADAEAALYPDNDAIQSVENLIWYVVGPTSYYYTGAVNFNGTKFSSTTVELTACATPGCWQPVTTGTATWSTLFTGADWVPPGDQVFHAQTRARDRARDSAGAIIGNLASTFVQNVSLVDFNVDDTAPVSVVNDPPGTGFIQSLNTIAGTSNSDLSLANTYYLRVWYVVGASSVYWNGNAWNTGTPDVPTQLPVEVAGSTGVVAWTFPGTMFGYSFPTITQADGTAYGIAIHAMDNAGNLEVPTTAQFVLDRVGPTIVVSTPMAAYPNYGTARPLATLRGTSNDSPAGVFRVDLEIKDISDTPNLYWDGGAWVAVSSFVPATSTNPWTYVAPPWIDNKSYQLRAKAVDIAGNDSGFGLPVPFKYDVNKPSTTITVPGQSFYPLSWQGTPLSGTALDWVNLPASEAKSGLTMVEIAIRNGLGEYWQGGAFNPAPAYRAVSTTTADPASWTYPPSNPAGDTLPGWADDVTYTVDLRSTDKTGNVENLVTKTFKFDAFAPTTTIVRPIDQSYATGFVLSSGTYSETVSPPGLQILVAVRNPLGAFWDGAAFGSYSPAASWRPAAIHVSSWTYVDSALAAVMALAGGPQTYEIFARGIDGAGNDNRGGVEPTVGTGKALRVDFFAPISGFTFPANNSALTGGVAPILGTANDQSGSSPKGVGLLEVKLKAVQIDSTNARLYWDGSNWVGADQGFNLPTTLGGAPQTVQTFQSQSAAIDDQNFVDGYRYEIIARAADLQGYTDTTYSTTTFVVDRSTPSASFNTPLHASYISTTTLTLSSGTFTEPLTGGLVASGINIVRVQIEDVSDQASPAHAIPGGLRYWDGLAWQAGSISTTAVVHASSWSLTALPTDWVRGDATPNGRQYAVRVFASDLAGNTGVFPNYITARATITFDGTPPTSNINIPTDGLDTTTLATITGQAVDFLVNSSSSDVRSVFVSVFAENTGNGDPNASLYWNQQTNSWVPSVVWNVANYVPASDEWQFNSATINANLFVGSYYVINSSATDRAGNASPLPTAGQPAYSRVRFLPPPAVTAITSPVSLQFYNALNALAGTANGVTSTVELQLKRADTGECWGGGAGFNWVPCLVDNGINTRSVTPSGGNWTYPPGGEFMPDWSAVNNTTFTIKATGINYAAVRETPFQLRQFNIDRSSPVSSVSFPTVGAFLAVPPTLTGATLDPFGANGSGIKNVKIQLTRTDNNFYWDQLASTWTVAVAQSTAAYASGTNSWSFDSIVSTLTWQDGLSYTLAVYAEDKAVGAATGNTEAPAAPVTFAYDSTKPLVSVVTPAGAPQRQKPTVPATIAGTASATAPNSVRKVQLRVLNDSNVYANPASFLAFNQVDGDLAWFDATYVADWTSWTASSAVPFLNGSTYTIVARSENQAGTYSVPYSSRSIVYDILAPESGVTVPANGSVIKTLPAITGTAADFPTGNPGTLSQMTARLKRLSDGKYWDGFSVGNWSAGVVDLGLGQGVVVHVSSWNFVSGNIPPAGPADLISGVSYYLTVAGKDNAGGGGNTEVWDSPRGSTFTYDDSPPLAGIIGPKDASFANSMPSFSGTSFDNVAVSTVQLSILDVTGTNCYNPAANAFNLPCPNWFGAQGSTGAWSYAFAAQPWVHAQQYVLRSSATDIATNIQTAISSAAFTFDTDAATAAVTVPAAGAIGPQIGSIAGTATDAPAGISYLKLAISSGAGLGSWYDGSVWTGGAPTFFTTSTYVLGAPDTWTWAYPTLVDGQLYRLRARTLDKAGNQRDQNFNFRFDSSSPTATVAIPVDGGYRTGGFAITGASSDPDPDGGGPRAPTNVSTVAVSIERLATGLCYVYGGAFTVPCPNFVPAFGLPGAWTYTPTPNPYTTGESYNVIARAQDNAGNTQDVFADGTSSNTFTYNTATPTVGVTVPSTARRSDLSTLAGTANDAIPTSLAKVQVRVTRTTGINRHSNPAGAHPFDLDPATQGDVAWFDAASVSNPLWTNWTLSSGLPWVSGEAYRVEARALNQAGTYSTTYSTQTTIYDTEAPYTDVRLPVAFSTVSALPQVTGTAYDLPLGNGGSVSNIRLRLTRLTDGQYWNGAGWTGLPTELTTSEGLKVHVSSWTLALNLPPSSDNPSTGLQNAVSYYMSVSGVDDALSVGNPEAFNDPVKASTFTVDLAGAVAGFTAPGPYSVISTLAKIRGTATDALAGVSTAGQIEIAIAENGPNNGCWNGTIAGGTFTLAGCPIYYPITGGDRGGLYSVPSTFWEVNAPPLTSQFGYKVWVRARDNATPSGNYTAPASISSITFTYNTNLPSAAILVPPSLPAAGGNLSAAFSISGTASDNFGVTGASIAYQEADTGMYYDGGSSTFSSLTPKWFDAPLSGSAPSYTFTATPPTPAASSGRNYNLFVKAINNAGLEQVAPASTVKWDTTKPVATTVLPANNSYGRTLPTVTGVASDPGASASGVGGSQIQIKRTVAGDCWSGAAWGTNCATEASWLASAAGSPWTKNTQLPPASNLPGGLEDGKAYEISARAFDLATNTQTATTANVFRFDVSSPAVANVLPLNGSRYKTLPTISGTAEDQAPGAFNVTFPRVRVYDIPLNQYWVDGTGWVTSAFPGFPDLWNTAIDSTPVSGVFTWRYDASAVAWPDRDSGLRVETQALDAAGNYTTASSTFSFDATRPGSYVLYPPNNGVTYSTMAVIGGTSTDNTSPITDVGIKMWYVTGPTTYYWSPAVPHWAPGDPGFASIGGSAGPAATINPWAYNSTQNPDFNNPGSLNYAWKEGTHDGGNGKLFHIITSALDAAGNSQVVYSTRTFRFDNVPPVSAPVAPINNAAYRSLITLSGTSSDDVGTVASAALSIYDEEAARYFNGTTFTSVPEVWLPILPANLFASSWVFTNGSLSFTTQHHYLVKSSATDNVGNVQSSIGSSRFLFDLDTPDSNVTNPANLTTYEDTKILIGGSSDPNFTSGINGGGAGVVPSLGWHQGAVDVVVFRDTAPLIGGGPVAFGGYDATGFFWNGSTWVTVAAAGGPLYVPASFQDAFGNWQYDGLTCPRPAPADPCWVRGDPYVSWIRVTDNAGNVQSVIQSGPRFFISGVAQSFSVTVSSNPSTVGNDVTVTVTARDGPNGTGGVASSYSQSVKFLLDGAAGPETPDTADPQDDLHGLPANYTFTTGTGGDNGSRSFTIRMRKAGPRLLRVEQTDNSALFGSANLTALRKVGTRVQLIADCDPLGQQPAPGVVTAGSEGRSGTPRVRTAGQTVTYCAQITDDFYNLDSDSTTVVYVTDGDVNNSAVSADQYLVVPGSVSFSRVFVTADPVGHVVTSTGSGVTPNAANPATPVVVVGGAADRLLALLPNETRVQGKFSEAPFGKTYGATDEVQAGSTIALRVYAVDPFYNGDATIAIPVTARLWTDSFTGSQTQTLQSGATTFVFTPVVAGTQSFTAQSASLPGATSVYYTPSPLKVWWAPPTKLQMIVEGQSAGPGKSPYTADPTTGGRLTSVPALLTAGVTTTITVNLVDNYYNVVRATTPFMTQTASVTMPLSQLDFLNDANIQGRGLSPNPFQRTLNAGTTTFSFIPVTRNAGFQLRVIDTNLTGTYYSTDTVTGITVDANVPQSLLVQMPGETYAEGTVTGKTGGASGLIAGNSYNVTLRAVDLYNNRANDGRSVRLSANDPYAVVPAPQSLALGQTIFAGFLPSAATGNLVVSGVDNDVIIPALTGQTVSTITVVPGTPDRMIIALSGQTLVPGKNVAPFGVTGVPTQSTAGVFFPATVYATDARYNVVSTVTKPSIVVTADDPFAPAVGTFAMNSGAASVPNALLRTAGTRVLTAVDGGGGTDALPTNGVSAGFDLLANNPTRLRVLTPAESRVPGSTTNGRSGPVHTAQAGFAFSATVDIADAFWNLTPGVTQQIRLVADDPFAVIVPTTQVVTTSATYTVTLKRAGSTILRAEMVDDLSLPTVSKDSSTAITVLAGTPSRLVAVLPGETFSQGSPTGKGGTPIAQTAGTGFDVQVGVVDGFFTLVPGRRA